MITIKQILENKENIITSLMTRNFDTSIIIKLFKLGVRRNKLVHELENLQKERNSSSRVFGIKKSKGEDVRRDKVSLDRIKTQVDELDKKLKLLNLEINKIILTVPNIPHKDAPIGKNENDNVVTDYYLENQKPNFQVIPHHEIISKLDIVDQSRAVKLSGSRFTIYKNKGAQLARALISFYLNQNIQRGYTELSTPVLVKSSALIGTGQLPKFGEDLFKIEGRDLWLIPTAEVSITNYYANEIINLSEAKLLTGFTECFRSEAGSAGKDVKGIIRLHQFKKVELVKITREEQKEEQYRELLLDIENLLTLLELPFRKLILCTGDLGFSSEYTIDFEVWLPSENRYLEISSASMFSDFQAKRMMLRYKDGKKNKYASTMNGSGLSIERVITTLVENHQTKDGNVNIPRALHKYLNFKII